MRLLLNGMFLQQSPSPVPRCKYVIDSSPWCKTFALHVSLECEELSRRHKNWGESKGRRVVVVGRGGGECRLEDYEWWNLRGIGAI